jgi:glycosyltransferase involved in cell wall biosynthesis
MAPSISVIIPAFNEEDNLQRAIDDTRAALASMTGDFEIIVVDDGSSDRTSVIAEENAQCHPDVRAIKHAINQGFGGAVLTGIAAARKDLVTYNSADSQFNISELSRFLPLIEHADIVLGYRTSRSDYSLYRRVNSIVFMWMMKLLFKVPVRDVNWVHLYRREVLERIPVRSHSIFFCGEIIGRAHLQGCRFAEVETTYYARTAGMARGGRISAVLKTVRDMLRIWWAFRVHQQGETGR